MKDLTVLRFNVTAYFEDLNARVCPDEVSDREGPRLWMANEWIDGQAYSDFSCFMINSACFLRSMSGLNAKEVACLPREEDPDTRGRSYVYVSEQYRLIVIMDFRYETPETTDDETIPWFSKEPYPNELERSGEFELRQRCYGYQAIKVTVNDLEFFADEESDALGNAEFYFHKLWRGLSKDMH